MSKIESEARQLHYMLAPKHFSDGYTWERDEQENHRLINRTIDKASDWVPATGISVLENKMVASSAWTGLFPVECLIEWSFVPQ